MGVKSDGWIRRMAEEHGMIEPFAVSQVRKGVVSYGVSSYGYDMRVTDTFRVFENASVDVIDPKNFPEQSFTEVKGDCVIPPHSYVLARSLEYFRIPRDILTLCFGKSTYARCGVVVNVTPFEPEWEGYVTMAICNTAPAPAKIYANEGIAQVVFLQATEPCEVSYADKKGKYQAQKEITPPKI